MVFFLNSWFLTVFCQLHIKTQLIDKWKLWVEFLYNSTIRYLYICFLDSERNSNLFFGVKKKWCTSKEGFFSWPEFINLEKNKFQESRFRKQQDFLILKMENLSKRFPHLSESILNQVNDQSLNKVKLISGDMLEYLDKERFFWIRLIKKYQNPHYCRYGLWISFFQTFLGFN